jgi:dUTP pyrophosphatase
MIDKFNKMRDEFKTVKELEKQLIQLSETDIDLSNPQNMMESLGMSIDELDKNFTDSFDEKLVLEYSLKSPNAEPEYAYPTDSGFDLRANETVHFTPFERKLVSTGLFLNIPEGYEIQVRPKSGLAIKKGLSVLNTPGTVDQGYTGEIKVIVINMSDLAQTIEFGDKIAQAVLCPVVSGKWVTLKRVLDINYKDRGENGFGSTGN